MFVVHVAAVYQLARGAGFGTDIKAVHCAGGAGATFFSDRHHNIAYGFSSGRFDNLLPFGRCCLLLKAHRQQFAIMRNHCVSARQLQEAQL